MGNIKEYYNNLPSLPGVYIFKDFCENVLYIGKAKNLKNRVGNYFNSKEIKASAIISSSTTIEHIVTKNEVEAMLLEAQLIKSYQPKFNILLKSGQPYLYLVFTKTKLPELKIARNKKEKGTYFGPFLEKGHSRRVYHFLIKILKLKLCHKKIPNGCLYYHIDKCAGSCRDDFDQVGYSQRLELAKKFLQYGHKKFIHYLEKKIKEFNNNLNFEKSKEFYELVQSFEKIFSYMETKFSNKEKSLAHKHIWISYKKYLFLFNEMNNTTKKKEFFITHNPIKYFESYYRGHVCPQVIITNFEIENKKDFETFLQKWHKKSFPISISTNPNDGHFQNLLELAKIHATQELEKSSTLGLEIKKLLKLPFEPKTIDCFDVSHKQGHFMVGSCIRFKNGEPDKENFRKFKIKTVKTQDDYKCLQEIVQRRYRDIKDLPDLILIDGGKGQLNAVNNIFPKTEFASLAKREETIYSKRILNGKKLNLKNFSGQSIISLRDYAHHFAISYHKIICQKSIIELI